VALDPAHDGGPRSVLSARGLRRDFSGFVAVRDVDLDVHHGKIHALIGPNGAGKTTVLDIISGFNPGAEGKVLYETTSRIGGVAQAGGQALLVAAGKRLVRVDAKGARTISVLDDAPDGVAVADDGVMFVSMPKGIVRMTKDSVNPVAVGIHGPLRMDQASLYVLLRDTNVVLRLTRK